MPYRRLPNTDSARLRALKTAFEKSEGLSPYELPFSQNTLNKLRSFSPDFEQAIINLKASHQNQVSKNKAYQELYRKAKLYLSHFIQVMNFAIIRGELPTIARTFYGMDENDKKVPNLYTEKDVIEWGEKIIKGENIRISKGRNPISNPTIAVVKVRYEQFITAYRSQKSLQITTQRANERIISMRSEADSIILTLWNEIEKHYSSLSADEMREVSKDYGVVYYSRSNEKSENDEIVSPDEIMNNNDLALQRQAVLEQHTFEKDITEEEQEGEELQYSLFFSSQQQEK